MAGKPSIAIVGAGRLGSALTVSLNRAGYKISEIVFRKHSGSRGKAQILARRVRTKARILADARFDADIFWLSVPDRVIASLASDLAKHRDWKHKLVFHSSGALTSDELRVLREQGAAVASVHPLMTFVASASPSLKNVPFAIEGDRRAVVAARKIARALGGEPLSIRKQEKPIHHAWGAFASPLLVALLATAEQVGRAAGLSLADTRKKMLPIVQQTIANYAELGPAKALTGPLVRADVETIRRHLIALQKEALRSNTPEMMEVYLSLSRAAVRVLPVKDRKRMLEALPTVSFDR